MSLMAPLKNPAVWRAPSVVVLVLANLIPLAGVLLLGWEVFPIMLLFWLENVIVGGFNVLKMLWAGGGSGGAAHVIKLFLIPFFCVHYGGFAAGHGVFVFALFGREMRAGHGPFPDLEYVGQQLSQLHLWWAVLGLAVSHGFSFLWNYLRRGEFRRTRVDQLMIQPYGRVMVLHIAIIGGGFLILALGSPAAALALLVVLKIGLDVLAHVKQHDLASGPARDPSVQLRPDDPV